MSRKLSHGGYSKPLLALAGLLFALATAAEQAPDGRRVFDEHAPQWLTAVGMLSVPGVKYREGHARNHREDCSATLVTDRAGHPADVIVTAWHCLEFYRDLSKPIIFTLQNGLQHDIRQEARRLADGGGMHADWAILRLQSAVPTERVAAMILHPGAVDPAQAITAAGYSRDAGLGQNGARLTYDPTCRITQRQGQQVQSDCTAYRGASGGAVVQLSSSGEAQLSGVISQGDSEGVVLYVPVEKFRLVLKRYL